MKKLKNSELNRISLEEFKNSSKTPIKVVLDNIRSAHNVGSIFRTCDACLLYTSPSPRDRQKSRMPSSA